jgi:hypothetical protein
MENESNRRHVFISHHHKDDAAVDKLTRLLSRKGYDIRNSSIRAKPANQARLDKGLVSDEVIRRLLRLKIAWAQTVVVLIGKETHTRPWVDWEIAEAHRRGKRIIGVYEHGGTSADQPANLRKYASNVVGWNAEGVLAAIDGCDDPFQNPNGSEAPPPAVSVHVIC